MCIYGFISYFSHCYDKIFERNRFNGMGKDLVHFSFLGGRNGFCLCQNMEGVWSVGSVEVGLGCRSIPPAPYSQGFQSNLPKISLPPQTVPPLRTSCLNMWVMEDFSHPTYQWRRLWGTLFLSFKQWTCFLVPIPEKVNGRYSLPWSDPGALQSAIVRHV